MKKAIREWAFNLFTKRITVKVANLPNLSKIEFLVNKLMNELVAQGYDIKGISPNSEYLTLFKFSEGERVDISSNNSLFLSFKRLPKI